MADETLSAQMKEVRQGLESLQRPGEQITTEDVSTFSLMPENMEPGDPITWRHLIDGLKKYHAYEPGTPTDIPVRDGQPYGIGVDIDVGTQFQQDDFDQMVESLWDDVKGYSVGETIDKIREWEDINNLSDAWRITREIPKLGAMHAYENVIGSGLSKSYAVDENSFGVRFYQTTESHYVNVSAGLTNYDLVLDKADEAAEYLDNLH